MQFVLRGMTFNLERDDVIKAAKGAEPEKVGKYAVRIGNKEYPVKQLIKLATKLSPADFTTHDAYRILRRLSFGIVVYD